MNTLRFEELLLAYEDDQLSPEELAEFKQLLASSPAARQRLAEAGVMQQIAASHAIPESIIEMPRQMAGRWYSWLPLTAAAAGIVFGMFCTSVVFAYVGPMWGKVVTLLDDGFESVSEPMATGVPTATGRWTGDFAEIVGPQNGVVPHRGAKMWRFLRADNAVGEVASPSYVGEAIHIIDLKPLRSGGAKAGGQIEISAWFAAGQTPPDHRYHWNIKAAAFEGRVADAPMLWQKWNEASTSLAQREVTAADQTGRWQRLSVTMALPPNADFLVFECAVVQKRPAVKSGVAEFPAHYVDDVRVRILPPTGGALAQE